MTGIYLKTELCKFKIFFLCRNTWNKFVIIVLVRMYFLKNTKMIKLQKKQNKSINLLKFN